MTICQDGTWVSVLTAVIYYRMKKDQTKISKGKRHIDKAQRKPGTSFPGVSPSGVTHDALHPQQHVATICVRCHPPGKLLRDSVPEVFIGGWPCRDPLPAHTNFRLPEGNMSSRNHTVQIKQSEPFLSASWGKSLKIQVPRHQPCQQIFPRLEIPGPLH